jgi:dipeptidyl aminopeptidase/acylaminoacyl peptidase
LPSAGLGSATGTDQTGNGGLPNTTGQITPTTGGTGTSASANGTIDDRAVGGVTKTTLVNETPSVGTTINKSGQVQYYDSTDGKFYKLDSNGKKIALSDKVFYSVSNVTWSADGSKAVLEYPDGSNVLYNFDTQKQVTLPAHWKDFSFSPDGSQLISKSMGVDTDNRYLVVSNDDGSEAKAVEKFGDNDATTYATWSPNNQMVAMYTEGIDANSQNVFFVGLNGENFKSTVIEGRGLQYQWSTNGDKLLYSVYNTNDSSNPRLWIVDSTSDTIGENRKSFSLQTWASKCTFASDTEVYCAVPNSLPEGSGLFPDLADKTEDSLYKIDLTTGTQKLIAIPDGSYNISKVVVSTDQSSLYFTDKFSGSIYKVKL